MDAERFWARVDKSGDCWLWMGARVTQGYGQVVVAGRTVGAHRYAYTLVKGPIPEGLVIDHLCRVTSCVRPDHLEAVTHQVNILRGVSPSARASVARRCHRGHSIEGQRTCLACKRERRKAAR